MWDIQGRHFDAIVAESLDLRIDFTGEHSKLAGYCTLYLRRLAKADR